MTKTEIATALRNDLRAKLKGLIHAAAWEAFARKNDGHLPWSGEIDLDESEFHLDIPPVRMLASVETSEGDTVWEPSFIRTIHFDVDNEWFEDEDGAEIEYDELDDEELLRLLETIEKI